MSSSLPPVASVAPRALPLRGASPLAAWARYWRSGFTFSGRASRSEYWWMTLLLAALNLVVALLPVLALWIALGPEGTSTTIPPLVAVALVVVGAWFLATLIPSIALLVRRLHDVNVSGWWSLLLIVPFGGVALLVLSLLEPKPEGARFDAPFARTGLGTHSVP